MREQIQNRRVLLAMGRHYIDQIHSSVAQYAGRNHWHLTNLFGNAPDMISNRQCDGIIAVLEGDDAMSEAIIRRRIPKVNFSIIRQHLKIPHLTGDNHAMGVDAARHFLERGFRNFIWFAEINHAVGLQRMKGFKTELQVHGFDCTALVVDDVFPSARPSWKTLQHWMLKAIRAMPQPCAVYAYNDVQAVNLLDACVAGGIRVPDEIAVLGTDNHPLVCPTAAVPLSSINHDLEELGRRAAEELDRIMDGAPMEGKTIIVPHRGITVRQSSDVFAINDNYVVNALRFIHTNFHRSIDVVEIVKAGGISRRPLERRFQEHLKTSILGKLNQLRIDTVCRLLRDTRFLIADIAAASGFSTPEYLHRVFLKKIGMTPRNYRMQNRSNECSTQPKVRS